jgi:hypothetical protein
LPQWYSSNIFIHVQPISHHIEFLTATILRWQHLLADNKFKQIILESLAWLSKEADVKYTVS